MLSRTEGRVFSEDGLIEIQIQIQIEIEIAIPIPIPTSGKVLGIQCFSQCRSSGIDKLTFSGIGLIEMIIGIEIVTNQMCNIQCNPIACDHYASRG
jgi:hypothetical protein